MASHRPGCAEHRWNVRHTASKADAALPAKSEHHFDSALAIVCRTSQAKKAYHATFLLLARSMSSSSRKRRWSAACRPVVCNVCMSKLSFRILLRRAALPGIIMHEVVSYVISGILGILYHNYSNLSARNRVNLQIATESFALTATTGQMGVCAFSQKL